jgi:hypothetical protein
MQLLPALALVVLPPDFLGLPAFRLLAQPLRRIAGGERLVPGKHTISFDFAYDGGGIGKGGRGTLAVDGKKVAEGRIENTAPFRFSLDESFDVGEDT